MNTRYRLCPLLSILALSLPPPAFAAADLLDLSLDALLELPVDTVTAGRLALRRQPATVTLFTGDELRTLGARNLMEALEFVPGTSFGVDVFGVISLNFRGQWAHEGKVLLLWDDMPLNDMMYGNLNLARHYPIEQIDRIEILRGAGAAKYGGNAQLAVIRIVSRAPERGFEATLGLDNVQGAGSGSALNLAGTQYWANGEMALGGHVSRGEWSGATWLDTAGERSKLADLSGFDTANFYLRGRQGATRWRALWDHHLSETPQFFGFARDGEKVGFTSLNVALDHEFDLGNGVAVMPRFQHRDQRDWWIDRDPVQRPTTLDFFIPVRKSTYGVDLRWVHGAWTWQGGVDYWRQHASVRSPGGPVSDPNKNFGGADAVDFSGKAAYLQGDWSEGDWAASGGLRYSDHSYAGSSLVPRIALAWVRDVWHVKLHYGQAFREPDVVVIGDSNLAGPPIQPERTQQTELEFGWKPDPRLFGTLSLFRMKTRHPIIYFSDRSDFFDNYSEVASEGVESEWRYREGAVRAHLTYSYYRAVGQPILQYAVALDPDQHLGAPQHKLTLAAAYDLPNTRWTLQGSVIAYSSPYAYDYQAGASGFAGNEMALRRLDAKHYFNLQARYAGQGWESVLGVSDLAGSGRIYPQPYLNESTPYPGPGRTLWARIGWSWK